MKFSQLFTDKDGNLDEMPVMVILCVLVYLYLSVYSVIWKGVAFDAQAFGVGIGGLIGAAATGMGVKSRFERDNDNNDNKQ